MKETMGFTCDCLHSKFEPNTIISLLIIFLPMIIENKTGKHQSPVKTFICQSFDEKNSAVDHYGQNNDIQINDNKSPFLFLQCEPLIVLDQLNKNHML